ncbi:MAG: serine/threonine protein kinase [Solirubrobacteraceae bacterium]|nr:serine/threonine protein kinase [Solirubrobacteraceae bacterium]
MAGVLGVGGMATVYRAEQLSLRRAVALKVLHPQLAVDPEFRARFRSEGTHVAALDHPNIVPVFDSGDVGGRLFLAMRLVEGQTLADAIRGQGVTPDETIELLGPIADALDLAHRSLVLHRDVKPQNILLSRDRRPFLADFGIAKGEQGSVVTTVGGYMGSVHYSAPEQIRGGPVAAGCDVYSLAIVAYECLAGAVPFSRTADVAVMRAHLDDAPPPLQRSPQVDRAVQAGLAKDALDRPATARAFIDALAEAIATLPAALRSTRSAFGGSAAPAPARRGDRIRLELGDPPSPPKRIVLAMEPDDE